MKKFILIIAVTLVLVFVLSFTACTDGDKTTPSKTDTITTEPDSSTLWAFEFVLNDDKASYSARIMPSVIYFDFPDVVIPSTHEGLPVTDLIVLGEAYGGMLPSTIFIPDSITSICGTSEDEFAYYFSPYLTKIEVDANNPCYESVDGVLYTKGGNRLICYPGSRENTHFSMPNTVEIVGSNAFFAAKNLKTVSMPDTVASIEAGAFALCENLESINISRSLTSIGNYAFSNCYSLKEIHIRGSVESIGEGAFKSCKSLKNISIPASVESIGTGALFGCSSLVTIEVSEDNERYSSFDGCLYNKDMTVLIKCPSEKSGNTFTVWNGVTTICSDAFEYCDFVSIVIPESVTKCEYDWTGYMSYLMEIRNESALDLSKYAKHVISDELQSAISNVDGFVFYDDGKEIYLVKYSGSSDKLTLPEYDGGKSYAIRDYAIWGNKTVTSIVIPATVTSIGYAAISYCTSLTSILFDGSSEQWNKIDKDYHWHYETPATEVVCTDKTISLITSAE